MLCSINSINSFASVHSTASRMPKSNPLAVLRGALAADLVSKCLFVFVLFFYLLPAQSAARIFGFVLPPSYTVLANWITFAMSVKINKRVALTLQQRAEILKLHDQQVRIFHFASHFKVTNTKTFACRQPKKKLRRSLASRHQQ